MPASGKMLKSREHAKNRALGIGDADGKLPARVKPANVMGKCTKCMSEIRMTSTNTEAKEHWSSRHPTCTFAECFPGQFDPTVTNDAETTTTTTTSTSTSTGQPVAKKNTTQDMSFLNEALSFNPNKVGNKKK